MEKKNETRSRRERLAEIMEESCRLRAEYQRIALEIVPLMTDKERDFISLQPTDNLLADFISGIGGVINSDMTDEFEKKYGVRDKLFE